MGRLSYANDLNAENAVYHQLCSTNFRTGKQIPQKFALHKYSNPFKKPRLSTESQTDERAEAFLRVTHFLEENDDEQITVKDLTGKMEEFLKLAGSTQEAYGTQYMKQKIKDHFDQNVIFTDICGKANVVTFRTTASRILQEYYKRPKCDNDDEEKRRIIETSAKLLKNDIRQLNLSTEYPTTADLSTKMAIDLLPDSVKQFLQILVVGKNTEKKRASLGHALIQAARPNLFLAPLQIGLAIQMHHFFGSKFLIESLHQHGFCSSYAEVQRFERSASVTPQYAELVSEDQFVQYSADNVDHNICTLDGHGTFHGMGMIAMVTPGRETSRLVPRKDVGPDEILRAGQVEIHQYNYPKNLRLNTYDDLTVLRSCHSQNPVEVSLTDVLWKASPFLQWPRPNWSGFMQMVHKGSHPGQANIVFLPMIDLNPTDLSCIYSTLMFISEQARRNNTTPVVTFDQPLWWKARTIIENEPQNSILKSVVLQIGGLHTEMSFLGCMGHLMENSGLSEALEIVYGSNTVGHMLNGKAIARARRGHFLVDAALNILLLRDAFNLSLPSSTKDDQSLDCGDLEGIQLHDCRRQPIPDMLTDDEVQNEESNTNAKFTEDEPSQSQVNESIEIDELTDDQFMLSEESTSDNTTGDLDAPGLFKKVSDVFQTLLSGVGIDENFPSDEILQINDRLNEEKQKNTSRTARLWLLYMRMVDILKRFLRGERTGNWLLHLQTLLEMLPYFAAAGHNLYTKTVYCYLQDMAKLKEDHPDIHSLFLDGLHVVRRSDRLWGGLSTDLIIEQVLMRSIKTTGGLTRGRGMSDMQRSIWINSLPACSEVNQAMQQFTGVTYHASDQHIEESLSRQQRDCADTDKVLKFLNNRSPFQKTDGSLRSIVSGVVAPAPVNVDEADVIGEKILESMKGQPIADYVFKKKHKAITMGLKSTVVIDREAVQINPQILFQRLTLVATRDNMDLNELLKYELCSYPTALFDSDSTPRLANKSLLADALWKEVKSPQESPSSQPLYVLDGGALLHRVPWTRGATFQDICGTYVRYVKAKYAQCIVVFDGYSDGPSVKDMAHLKRGSNTAVPIHFEPDMALTVKKEVFLSNTSNKQRFINLLSTVLENSGCQTIHARADADLLIVQTAVDASVDRETVVVADDTDILILLCYYGSKTKGRLYMKPEAKQGTNKIRVWDIKTVASDLGIQLCSSLPFIHAFLGCDATSHLFGIGKGSGVKKSKDLQQPAGTFSQDTSSNEEIIKAGEKAMTVVYGGKPNESLDSLRCRRFREKVTKSTKSVEIKTLPPPSTSAKFHSLRVYYQVQVWLGNQTIQPTDWGWQVRQGIMYPIMTDKPPAPEKLLKMIRCNCKSGCNSMNCSCRKYGIDCSSACGECHGTSCLNSPQLSDDIMEN